MSNEELARRAVAPWWYHPALGLLTGGLLAFQAAPLIWRGAYFLFFGIGLMLLVQVYRKRTGIWVSGYRRGRTMIVTVVTLILALAVMLTTVRLGHGQGRTEAFLYGGALIALIVTVAGPLWERAFRADLAGKG